jgi:hypothetical protein
MLALSLVVWLVAAWMALSRSTLALLAFLALCATAVLVQRVFLVHC